MRIDSVRVATTWNGAYQCEAIRRACHGVDPKTRAEVPSKTECSTRLLRALKDLGFAFVGPTTCYSFMQSHGLVKDHAVSCFRHAEVSSANSLASTRQEG